MLKKRLLLCSNNLTISVFGGNSPARKVDLAFESGVFITMRDRVEDCGSRRDFLVLRCRMDFLVSWCLGTRVRKEGCAYGVWNCERPVEMVSCCYRVSMEKSTPFTTSYVFTISLNSGRFSTAVLRMIRSSALILEIEDFCCFGLTIDSTEV